jgi:hypothetical protein
MKGVFHALHEMAGTTRGKISGFVTYGPDFEKKRRTLRKSQKTGTATKMKGVIVCLRVCEYVSVRVNTRILELRATNLLVEVSGRSLP